MTEQDYNLNTHTLRRVAEAITHHLTALSVIPMYPENKDIRAMHEKLLRSAMDEMKELLNG